MEESDPNLPISSPSISISDSPSGLASSSSSSHSSSSQNSQAQETQEQNQQENPEQRQINGFQVPTEGAMSSDSWSCFIMLASFWFFASMTLILGFYGPIDLRVGPNCSRLLQANSYFINQIKVQQLDGQAKGLMLYGFESPPSLDVEKTWFDSYNVTLPAYSHEEWIYFLNKGSEISIDYNVNSPISTEVFLVIAEGKDSLIEWTQSPSYPNITLSWNVIHGTGTVQQKLSTSSDYYVAVGNLNSEEVKVQVNLKIRALVYNTTKAYYKCSPSIGPCGVKLRLLGTGAAVLTSSAPEQGSPTDDWYVKVSYGERWISYFLGSGVVTIFILLVFKLCVTIQGTEEPGASTSYQPQVTVSERTPLLVNKDDDLSSWGSSYDSVSHDEDDIEECFAVDSIEGRQLKEGENSNPRRLCAICFDAPRDCFFLPCGHCATCFACGTRIAEEAGICPICRRKMKKVRKIFAV